MKCKKCGDKLDYNEKYDSYYCKKCNIWLEDCCSDPKCRFCSKRPKKPINRSQNL